MRDLFTGKAIEAGERIPQRPLGEFSTFVVEQMPLLIEGIRARSDKRQVLTDAAQKQFVNLPEIKVNELLGYAYGKGFGIGGKYPFDQRLDLAAFDLKVLETALLHLKCEVPEGLSELVERFADATDQLPSITYEDLIYINPEHDPRTFTIGEVGESEFSFYQGHNQIERYLETVIRGIECAAYQLQENQDGTRAARELIMGTQAFVAVIENTRKIGLNMSMEHFSYFRMFFSKTSLRPNLNGPSGLYTAAIPIIEILLAGENLPEEPITFVKNNLVYFPRKGRLEINKAVEKMQRGETITAFAQKMEEPPMLMDAIEGLSKKIREFRGMHYKGVKHQIPAAVSGELAGSGGAANPGEFLRGRMKTKHII